jgi:Domain of unknown function (DUF4158)
MRGVKRHWSTDELIDEWTLRPEELRFLGRKTGSGRLGFAILLKFFQHEGRFPRRRQEIPGSVVTHIAKQVGISAEAFLHYTWGGRTMELHRAQIRAVFKFHEATVEDANELSVWLSEQVLPREQREDRLVDVTLSECRVRGIEPPSPERLTRIVRSAIRTFERDFFAQTLARLSPQARAELEKLVAIDDTAGEDISEDAIEISRAFGTSGESRRASEARELDTDTHDTDDTPDEEGWDTASEAPLDDGKVAVAAAGAHVPGQPHAGYSLRHHGREGEGGGGGGAPSRADLSGIALGALFKFSKDSTLLTLHDLRMDPGPTGLESMLLEIAKLTRLRQIGLPRDLFADLAPHILRLYRNRAASEAPSTLRAHPTAIRLTLLAALCWVRSQEVTDNLVALLLALLHRMSARAERRVEREYIAEIRRVAGKASILFHVAEAAVAHPEGIVREVIFPAAGGERTLADLVKEYKATGLRYRAHVYLVMKQSFTSYYRRMLPPLLEVLDFRSNNEAHQPIIRALALIREYMHSGLQFYPADEVVPLVGIVRPIWRDLVVEQDADGTLWVQRLPYELCALQVLRDSLRSKEVWVVGARRFRNPEEDLPRDFEDERAAYYAALRLPDSAEAFVAALRSGLVDALARLDGQMVLTPR